jgi:DNA-binding transcriptional regulator YiaG
MPKRTPLDWEDLERELHAAGVSPGEIEAGARQLLAQARGHQLAETRKQLALGQKQIAAAMGVSIARVSQIEHGVTRARDRLPQVVIDATRASSGR